MGGIIDFKLRCIECGSVYDDSPIYRCPKCRGLLDVSITLPGKSIINKWHTRPFNVWRYKEVLPVKDSKKIISLEEGGTRFLKLENIMHKYEVQSSLYIKIEGDNPTGSFKDRGMTVGITKALEFGYKGVICASTGNTSASMSAYAAKAGLKRFVFIPKGKIAGGKLSQAIAYGATIIEVDGVFDHALKLVLKLVENTNLYLLNSVNPYRLEGQKTIAYEIYEQLGDFPNYVIVPVGNAGNISAIWKGFKELFKIGVINELPKMVGVQAAGAAPLARAYIENREYRPVTNPETIASAIRIGNPVNWPKALNAVKESNGFFIIVSDKEIINAQMTLAKMEGVFVEPASSTPLAGYLKYKDCFDGTVVLIATGHGLKDSDIILSWPHDTYFINPREQDLSKIKNLFE